jgi:hypothetical protein
MLGKVAVADGIEGGPSFADFGDESRGGTGVYESTGQTAFPEPAWPREARPTSFRPQSATRRMKKPGSNLAAGGPLV